MFPTVAAQNFLVRLGPHTEGRSDHSPTPRHSRARRLCERWNRGRTSPTRCAPTSP